MRDGLYAGTIPILVIIHYDIVIFNKKYVRKGCYL